MVKKGSWNFCNEQPVSTWFKYIPEHYPQVKKQKRIIESLLESPDFKSSIINLRKRFGIKVGELDGLISEFSEANHKNNLLVNKKIAQYRERIKDKEIIELLKRFNLPPLWFQCVYQYLNQNKMDPVEIKCDVVSAEDKYGRGRLFIEIFVDTTLEDIKEAWNSIIYYQKRLPDYWRKTVRSPKNKQIHADILKWRESGKSNAEVARLVEERYPDYNFNPEAIRQIKHRAKRDIKKLS